MSYDFICPHCKGHLCSGEDITLTVKKKRWKGGLLMLHPEVGNYNFKHHPSLSFTAGEKVEFLCPICHHNLSSKKHPDLALIYQIDKNGREYQIYFSKIAGQKSTFRMTGDFVEVYGKDADSYKDLFNLSQLV